MNLIKEALEKARAAQNEARGTARVSGSAAGGDHRYEGSVTTHSGAQVLAGPRRARITVDWAALRESGVLAPLEEDERIARQIRDIKRPLIAHAFGKRATSVENGNLIMVTSAVAGEGKTFISFNLARSMAGERDHSVLLVDADVAKPHTSALLGLEDSVGLLDLLEDGDAGLETAIVETDVPGFSVLPAGKRRPHSTELLASFRMEQLARKLMSLDRSRVVLFDSPPLLQTSESKVLAEHVGQIVFVVCANKTPKGAVAEAVISLGEERAVNFVLNKATTNSLLTHYASYGSGYGYGGLGRGSAYPTSQQASSS